MNELTLHTSQHTQFVEITDEVRRTVTESGVQEGICTVFVPHTTAGITINENADPDVLADMIYALEKVVPWRDAKYRHGEATRRRM
jgi:secondary thiamine-phosphate synthase enzyme